jgi:hypothetical protein
VTALSSRVSEGNLSLLADTVAQLPDTARALPGYAVLQQQYTAIAEKVAARYSDVKDVLAKADMAQRFREQPFEVIKAWACSTSVTMNREDDIAVLLDWWARGVVGKKCSDEQYRELSALVCVEYLTPGAECLGLLCLVFIVFGKQC